MVLYDKISAQSTTIKFFLSATIVKLFSNQSEVKALPEGCDSIFSTPNNHENTSQACIFAALVACVFADEKALPAADYKAEQPKQAPGPDPKEVYHKLGHQQLYVNKAAAHRGEIQPQFYSPGIMVKFCICRKSIFTGRNEVGPR